jgi:hypothetical protein
MYIVPDFLDMFLKYVYLLCRLMCICRCRYHQPLSWGVGYGGVGHCRISWPVGLGHSELGLRLSKLFSFIRVFPIDYPMLKHYIQGVGCDPHNQNERH